MISFREAIRRFFAEKRPVRWRHLAQWFLRDERLRPERSLRFAFPLYGVSILAVVAGKGLGTVPPTASGLMSTILLALLLLEAVGLILSLFRYLTEIVFMPAAQRASDILRLCPEADVELKRLAALPAAPSPGTLETLAIETLNTSVLAAEALRRLVTFGSFAFRLLIAFVVATVALVHLQPTGGPEEDVFLNVNMSDGLPLVLERAVYLNLVVIATLGFGDMAPIHSALPARVLTDIEIVTSSLLVLFGVNLLIGLVLEGSAASWAQRQIILQRHFRKLVADRQDATSTWPNPPNAASI